MTLENIFNPDLLYFGYVLIGYFVFSIIIKILKIICIHTRNKFDDRVVEVLEKWHKVNKEKIKK